MKSKLQIDAIKTCCKKRFSISETSKISKMNKLLLNELATLLKEGTLWVSKAN